MQRRPSRRVQARLNYLSWGLVTLILGGCANENPTPCTKLSCLSILELDVAGWDTLGSGAYTLRLVASDAQAECSLTTPAPGKTGCTSSCSSSSASDSVSLTFGVCTPSGTSPKTLRRIKWTGTFQGPVELQFRRTSESPWNSGKISADWSTNRPNGPTCSPECWTSTDASVTVTKG